MSGVQLLWATALWGNPKKLCESYVYSCMWIFGFLVCIIFLGVFLSMFFFFRKLNRYTCKKLSILIANLVFEDSGVNVQTFQRDRRKTSETPEKSKLIEHNIKGGGIVSDKWWRMATDVPCLEVPFSEDIPILQTCATFNLKKFDCAMAIW